jgi:hypothetical protein
MLGFGLLLQRLTTRSSLLRIPPHRFRSLRRKCRHTCILTLLKLRHLMLELLLVVEFLENIQLLTCVAFDNLRLGAES